MKLTCIGMNNGSIKERDRLIEALRDTRDQLEDCYAAGSTYGRLSSLKAEECELMASLAMVMRCDAVHVHPARPVSPRLPSGAYFIEQGHDYAVFGGVIL